MGKGEPLTAYVPSACPQARGSQMDGYLLPVYNQSQSRASIGSPCIQPADVHWQERGQVLSDLSS